MIQEIIDLHCNIQPFIMIRMNLVFQVGLSQYGIVYRIVKLHLLPQIHLKHVLINFGRTKIFDTIGKPTILFTSSCGKVELTIDNFDSAL